MCFEDKYIRAGLLGQIQMELRIEGGGEYLYSNLIFRYIEPMARGGGC